MFLKQYKNNYYTEPAAGTLNDNNNNNVDDEDDDIMSGFNINTVGNGDEEESKDAREQKAERDENYQSELFGGGQSTNVSETGSGKTKTRTFSQTRWFDNDDDEDDDDEPNDSDENMCDNVHNKNTNSLATEQEEKFCKSCAEKGLDATKKLITLNEQKIQECTNSMMNLPFFDKSDQYQRTYTEWFMRMHLAYSSLKDLSNGVTNASYFAIVSETSSTAPFSNTLSPFNIQQKTLQDTATAKRIEPWSKNRKGPRYFKPKWMQTPLDSITLAIPMYVSQTI